MAIRIRAHYDGKTLVPNEPLEVPQNEELEIDIRLPSVHIGRHSPRRSRRHVTSMPFFGMWADREDMKDSISWVRKERERWKERLNSPD